MYVIGSQVINIVIHTPSYKPEGDPKGPRKIVVPTTNSFLARVSYTRGELMVYNHKLVCVQGKRHMVLVKKILYIIFEG